MITILCRAVNWDLPVLVFRRFADRAKKIINKPSVNKAKTADSCVGSPTKAELQQQLRELSSKNTELGLALEDKRIHQLTVQQQEQEKRLDVIERFLSSKCFVSF